MILHKLDPNNIFLYLNERNGSLLVTELNSMKEAYGMLYTLENSLRLFIKLRMREEYGINWFHTAPRQVLKRPPSKDFDSLNFHDLETSYIRIYKKAFPHIPTEFFKYLQSIYPLRNKIAHSHPLSENEYHVLLQSYNYLITFINE
ncbi:Swt1 family HEPN domain-containing protein [Mesobacillus subterraneus]|uniref:Swt1 family HEPN domain-containing protein n=1 Tax=Mesobacillus subterraneus TaxID=285983 RepID=UPI003CCC6790